MATLHRIMFVLSVIAVSLIMFVPTAQAEIQIEFGQPSNHPFVADFTGDGLHELVVHDAEEGKISIRKMSGEELASELSLPPPGFAVTSADYDGDGKADLGFYDQINGIFYAHLSSLNYQLVSFPCAIGTATTELKPADYDGDGLADPAFYDSNLGTWIVYSSESGYQEVSFTLGGNGTTAVPKDYDGDSKADPAVYDLNSGTWTAYGSASGYSLLTASLGGPGCAAAPEDFDGDGKADPAVYSAALGKWGVLHSAGNYRLGLIDQGGPDYMPVPGNYYSTNHANYAVYSTNHANYAVYSTTTNNTTTNSLWLIANDNYIPRPIRAVFYPIYNNAFPAYAPANLKTGELAKLNLIFIAFAHVYGSTDASFHFSPNLKKPTNPANVILAYENARYSSSPLTNGDYDYDRIKQIADAVHSNGGKVLISLGYDGDGAGWTRIIQDYHTTNSMFADSVVTFLATNNLDGFDIDYESMPSMSAGDFAGVCSKLREKFGNKYLLSITPCFPDDNIKQAITNFDLINTQSYWDNWNSAQWNNLGVSDSCLTFGMTLDPGQGTHNYQGLVNFWTSNKNLGGVFIWSMTDVGGSYSPSTYDAIDYMFDNMHY